MGNNDIEDIGVLEIMTSSVDITISMQEEIKFTFRIGLFRNTADIIPISQKDLKLLLVNREKLLQYLRLSDEVKK